METRPPNSMGFHAYFAHKPMPSCVYRKKYLKWIRESNNRLIMNTDDVPFEDQQTLREQLALGGQSCMINIHMMQKVFSQGPKVLKLSNIDFEILENTDINLTNEEYTQPFEAIVIDFPENYLKDKVVGDPLEGINYAGDLHEATHCPVFATVVKDKEANCIFISIHLTSYDVYTVCLASLTETIQEQLDKHFGEEASAFDASLPITNEETSMYLKLIRASLNACLYVDDNGYKKQESDKQRKRLEHFVDVAKKSKDQTRISKAFRELKSYPVYFEFNQVIKLRKVCESSGQGVGGWTCKPHWRKGHYRMQRFGPGNLQQKRLRIEPVLVNSELFLGDVKNTKVEYND